MTDLGQMLHVIGGYSAAGSLKVALRLRHGQLLVNEDMLSCGPTPATEDLTVWRSTRENYLRGILINWPDLSFDEYADNGLLMNASRLAQASPVAVWMK